MERFECQLMRPILGRINIPGISHLEIYYFFYSNEEYYFLFVFINSCSKNLINLKKIFHDLYSYLIPPYFYPRLGKNGVLSVSQKIRYKFFPKLLSSLFYNFLNAICYCFFYYLVSRTITGPMMAPIVTYSNFPRLGRLSAQ